MRKRGEKGGGGGGRREGRGGEWGLRLLFIFIRRIGALAAVELSSLVVDKVLRQQRLNMWDLEVILNILY